MKPVILEKLVSNWEHTVCVLAILACIVLCVAALLFGSDHDHDGDNSGKKLKLTMLFPWSEPPYAYDGASVPEVERANPFAHGLASLLPKPEPKKAPEPEAPKPEPPTQTPPDKAAPAQEKTAPEPPKAAERLTITMRFRGIYVNLAGEKIAMLTVSDSKTKATKRLQVREGMTFEERFMVATVTDADVTIQTCDGQLKSIPWNSTYDFDIEN